MTVVDSSPSVCADLWAPWKQTNSEEGSWLVPDLFFHVCDKKCVASLATDSQDQVLVGIQE